MKVQFTTDGGGSYVVDLDEYKFKVSPHFALYEVANNQAKDEIKMIMNPSVQMFFRALEEFRQILVTSRLLNLSVGMKVSSCYRTQSFNASTKGASQDSDHLNALSIDFTKDSFLVSLTDQIRYIVSGIWEYVCNKFGVIGYINWYTRGFHLGFTNRYKKFTIVDYRGKSGDW